MTNAKTTAKTGARFAPAESGAPVKGVLVLGVGNILLSDEGAGVRAAEVIGRLDLGSDVEVLDGATAGADLAFMIAGRRKVIVIDAAQYDAAPGTVLRFGLADIEAGRAARMSLHELGVVDAVAIAGHLGEAPGEVVFFGIVPKTFEWGLELSAEVERAIPKVIDAVLAELRRPKAA
jgi:hydrogenase maturation protease